MSERLISVLPAEPGHLVSIKEFSAHDEPENPWGPWIPVLAWGFSEFNGPIPITLYGQPHEWAKCAIKTPDGKIVR